MKHFLAVLLLFLCTCTQGFTQVANNFKPENLKVTWELVQNNYQGKPTALSALNLINNGQVPFPENGWSLYFNSSPSFKPEAGNTAVKVEHINGDLMRLIPTENFKGIPAGGKQRLEFVSNGQVLSKSSAPTGFYLVWDKDKTRGYAVQMEVNSLSKDPAPENKEGWVTPDKIYEQNKAIKDIPVEKLTKVFPTPVSYTETKGSFTITPSTTIIADDAFKGEAALLAEHLAVIFGRRPSIKATGKGKVIRLQKKDGLPQEGYELQVSPNEVLITATTPTGAFYATQSLKTLIPPTALTQKQKSVNIQAVNVTDSPRFGHRAFMMDVSRNFQPKEQVIKILDLMALYKLNVLHFHLNDDEGWRLEIPALPELTEVGAKRGHTLDNKKNLQPSLGSGPEVDKSAGSGYYSRKDYVDILRYATERHIRVIPEFETPGHARAAIKSMDARYERLMAEGKKSEAERYLLRDLNDKSVYRSVQNWNDNVIDVALPSTYNFLETVLDETLKMYKEAGAPIQMVHFGGDEVPGGVWEKSPAVQELIKKDPKVNNTDDLWYYFFGKVNDMLKKRNLYLYGWEEIGLRKTKLDGKNVYIPNPDFVDDTVYVDVWNNLEGAEDLAYKLANAGYKVVLTNVTNLYLDLSYQKNYEEEGLNWGGYLDVDKPFYFIPYDYLKNTKEDTRGEPIDKSKLVGKQRLTDYGKSNIIGLQAPLWSETILTSERLEYMLLPKLLGLAERAWAPDPAWATETEQAKSELLYNQSWSEFVNLLGKRELPRLNYYAGGFNYRIPTAGAVITNGKLHANVQLPGFEIRYATDGSEPTRKSQLYTGPVNAKGTVKLRVFDASGRGGRVVTISN